MRYCDQCKKEVESNSEVCAHCGCITKNYNIDAILQRPSFRPTVITTSLKKMWGVSMLGGLGYGLLMGFFVKMLYGLLMGVIFGIIFGTVMHVVVTKLEKKFEQVRCQISKDKRIIVEGGANMNGNGGWLFITEKGVEYYTHRFNVDHIDYKIPHQEIQFIGKEGKNLCVVANNVKHKFVVNSVDSWLSAINCI